MATRGISAPTLWSWLLLGVLGLLWGSSFLAVKYALVSYGPLTIAAARILLAAFLLTFITYAMGLSLPALDRTRGRRIWAHALGMGLLSNAVPFSLLNWGQQSVTSGFAGITMALVPLFVLPLAHFLVPGDRMSLTKFLGFCLGVLGVAILIGPSGFDGGGGDQAYWGRLACLAATCCYASGVIVTRLSPEIHPLAFASAGLLVAALVVVPTAVLIEGVPPLLARPRAVMAVVYLGLFSTATATVLLVYIINSVSPSFLSLVNFQVPIWAAILGVVMLSETLPGRFIFALAIILGGVAISQMTYTSRRRSHSPP